MRARAWIVSSALVVGAAISGGMTREPDGADPSVVIPVTFQPVTVRARINGKECLVSVALMKQLPGIETIDPPPDRPVDVIVSVTPRSPRGLPEVEQATARLTRLTRKPTRADVPLSPVPTAMFAPGTLMYNSMESGPLWDIDAPVRVDLTFRTGKKVSSVTIRSMRVRLIPVP